MGSFGRFAPGLGRLAAAAVAVLAATTVALGAAAAQGPEVTFFGVADADGCGFCCGSICRGIPTPTPEVDEQGRRVWRRDSGRFLLVVEARPGASFRQPGRITMDFSCQAGASGTCTGLPDLQLLVSRDLGNGSPAVCDTGATGGGVPGVSTLAFDGSTAVLDAANDLSCRFSLHVTNDQACTRNTFGNFAFRSPETTTQYCFLVPTIAEFPEGDTVVKVRLRDTAGNIGPEQEIVVRVGREIAPTPTPTPAIEGVVVYYRDARPVPGVDVELLGPAAGTATTDAGGFYSLAATADTWTVRPSKIGDDNGAISSVDAAYALQAAVGRRVLDGFEMLACDTNRDGSITAIDAALILQRVVGRIARLPVADSCGSDWAFVPQPDAAAGPIVTQPDPSADPCRPGSVTYDPLSGTAVGQDFVAVLFGDCSGNWVAP